MLEKMWPCSAHDAYVTVSKYECGVMEGCLVHPRFDAPKTLKSISQLICLLDFAQKLENVECCPQHYEETFHNCQSKLASFTISLLFRENYTIQGRMVWNEGARETAFKSVLELIHLLDDILTAQSRKSEEKSYE